MTGRSRHDLFKALPPEAVPNPSDDGRTSLINHRVICRVCRTDASVRRTLPGDGQKNLVQLEANQEAVSLEVCDACGSVNLSAIVAEPDARAATELS